VAGSVVADHAVSHLSRAEHDMHLIQLVPYAARHRSWIPIPIDVQTQYGLVQESLYRQGPNAPGIREAISEIAGWIRAHLETSKKLQKDVPLTGQPVMLPMVTIERWLARLETSEYNPFALAVEKENADWALPWALWRNSRKNFQQK